MKKSSNKSKPIKSNNKNVVSSAIALALGSAGMAAPQIVAASTLTFDWIGVFTMVAPDGYILSNTSITSKFANTFQTPVNGIFTFDTDTGIGTGSVQPFNFFGNPQSLPATARDLTIQSIGGNLVLGNALFDWNGNLNMPVSLVWDATGLFSAISAGLNVGDTVSGVGAIPASDGTYIGLGWGYLANGPTPIATTTFNTTNVAGCLLGDCIGVNPSGTTPLITDTTPFGFGVYHSTRTMGLGGSPMQDGPFPGFNANFDIQSLTLISITPEIPIPAAVWLFGSGLLGLVGVSRHKKTSH
jgi:hypothetical protein